MLLKYRNGRSTDDRFFDIPLDAQRFHVSQCLNLNPSTPLYWPMSLIDHLIAIRRHEGLEEFYREVGTLLDSHKSGVQ